MEMEQRTTMRIAELSQRSGIPIPTIKFYLREKLLSRGKRTARNQAEYSEEHLQRLRLIRALVEVGGLPLGTVREVLNAIDDRRIPLHDMLGVAHYALGPRPEATDSPRDLADAMIEVDAFLRDLRWNVKPNSPARRGLAQALRTLRRLGRPADVRLFEPYARAADGLAKGELATIDLGAPRSQVVEDIVIGTVVFEAALAALRRLAQEHHAASLLASARGARAMKRGRRPARA